MNDLQHSAEASEGTFSKGMTLEQYMAGIAFDGTGNQPNLDDEKQQNLLESSLLSKSQVEQTRGINYLIEEIDEESLNQSVDDRTPEFPKDYFKEQLTKETFREPNHIESKKFSKKTREDKMRNTAYFNHGSMEKQKQNFRVKNVSNSPARKKTENSNFNGALTLYGHKFKSSKEKQDRNLELATFYGKLPKGTDRVEASKEPKEMMRRESRKTFKNKGHLEMKELIEFETRIKNNFSQKICMKDLRVEGLRDRFHDRKNKFC